MIFPASSPRGRRQSATASVHRTAQLARSARNGRGLVPRLRARPPVWQAPRAARESPVRQREVLVSSAGSKIPLAAGEVGDAANESTRELALSEDD
jgi:hypothetical protein